MKYLPSILAVTLFTLFMGPLVASAQGYVPLVSLPGIELVGGKVVLESYLQGMIKLVIALAGALAILMLVIAGTKYVAASINPNAKKDAVGDIQNALIGLALVLSSYLLLNTINPELVNFKLILPPISGIKVAPGVTVAPPVPACINCVTLNSSIPQKPPGSGCSGTSACQVSTNIAGKLLNLSNALRSSGTTWQVTEMWPPTRTHANACHQAGTCVDAALRDTPITAAKITSFITAASGVGMRAQYEVPTVARFNELVAAGLSSPRVIYVPGITGEHFSVYNN